MPVFRDDHFELAKIIKGPDGWIESFADGHEEHREDFPTALEFEAAWQTFSVDDTEE